MKMIDFTPLFRTAIGFDRLANTLESAYRADAGGYPPYNIEVQGDDRYRITLAVAGFTDSEIDIEVKDNVLRIAGKKGENHQKGRFLHRGIANRSFERTYQLADYVRVTGAKLSDGLLHVDLLREVPETMKPRRIEIRTEREKLIGSESEAA
jgi:molecular chaperone IbpA